MRAQVMPVANVFHHSSGLQFSGRSSACATARAGQEKFGRGKRAPCCLVFSLPRAPLQLISLRTDDPHSLSVFFLPNSSLTFLFPPTLSLSLSPPPPDSGAMSWVSWTSLVPTLLILLASLAWWFAEPKNARINLIAFVGLVLFVWAVAPEFSRDLTYSVYAWTADAVAALRLDLLVLNHANMLLTGGAAFWYVGVCVRALVAAPCPWWWSSSLSSPFFPSLLLHRPSQQEVWV